MSRFRAIGLPSLATLVAFLAITFYGAHALQQQFTGQIADHWLLSPLWSRTSMLTVFCAGAYWSGYRISTISNSLIHDAFAGIFLPILGLGLVLLAGLIETGDSEIDELGSWQAVASLCVVLLGTAISSVVGGIVGRRRSVA